MPDRPSPPKGCDPTIGADLVAVDIDVARVNGLGDVLHAVVDARVQAESQPIARGIDVGDDLINLGSLEADDMQDRAKHFALQCAQYRGFRSG